MKSLPQIRLRTFFLIFFCAAIGMTSATAPEAAHDSRLKLYNIYFPQFNLYCAFLMAAAVAMIIGLAHHARTLVHWKDPAASNSSKFAFARQYAIAWRILLSLTIALCALMQILFSRKVVSPPKHADLMFHQTFPEALLLISVVVVLCANIRRWKRRTDIPHRSWYELLAGALGVILALLILPDSGLVTYLVHIATSNIELAGKFQRSGVFPNQLTEHFQSFWISLGAVVSIVMAMVVLNCAQASRFTSRSLATFTTLYILMIGAPALYCVWFYRDEFHRLSPDMASTGFVSLWLDWLGGGMIVVLVNCVGAYRLSVQAPSESSSSIVVQDDINPVALHESALCLLFVFGGAATYLIEAAWRYWSQPSFFGSPPILAFAGSLIQHPETSVMLALFILSSHLCWLRWKRRNEAVAWKVYAIDRTRFIWNWLAIALLIVVAIPTLSIYCLTFWMGPWYLYGPK